MVGKISSVVGDRLLVQLDSGILQSVELISRRVEVSVKDREKFLSTCGAISQADMSWILQRDTTFNMRQYPIQLNLGQTIHRVQGETINGKGAVAIRNLDACNLTSLYTAFSRFRTFSDVMYIDMQ